MGGSSAPTSRPPSLEAYPTAAHPSPLTTMRGASLLVGLCGERGERALSEPTPQASSSSPEAPLLFRLCGLLPPAFSSGHRPKEAAPSRGPCSRARAPAPLGGPHGRARGPARARRRALGLWATMGPPIGLWLAPIGPWLAPRLHGPVGAPSARSGCHADGAPGDRRRPVGRVGAPSGRARARLRLCAGRQRF
jgi:hypothetical protein